MARILLLSLALSALAFAPAPLPKKDRSPPLRLEGFWEGGSGSNVWRLQITAVHVVYRPNAPSETACDLVVHPKATPPAYDFSHHGSRWSGIFRLEGDKLTLCYRSGDNRPTNFVAGGGQTVEVYKRTR